MELAVAIYVFPRKVSRVAEMSAGELMRSLQRPGQFRPYQPAAATARQVEPAGVRPNCIMFRTIGSA